MIDPVVIGTAFVTIVVVELPDKTFIATLVLGTRFRPLLVWLGVGLAFALQTGIAVALGKAATFLPTTLVQGAAVLLFLAGAVLLFVEARRQGRGEDADPTDEGEEYAARAGSARGGLSAVGASFLVLFAAEWGDLSQLLTLSLVARYDDPVGVFVGALAALLTVSGLAILVGRALLQRVGLRTLHYAGATVCLVLASLTLWELLS